MINSDYLSLALFSALIICVFWLILYIPVIYKKTDFHKTKQEPIDTITLTKKRDILIKEIDLLSQKRANSISWLYNEVDHIEKLVKNITIELTEPSNTDINNHKWVDMQLLLKYLNILRNLLEEEIQKQHSLEE